LDVAILLTQSEDGDPRKTEASLRLMMRFSLRCKVKDRYNQQLLGMKSYMILSWGKTFIKLWQNGKT
jgi:hypothetical protein